MRAQYWVEMANPGEENHWVEAMEMPPAGARFRLREDAPVQRSHIVIEDDGTATYEADDVEIELYENTGD